MKLKLYDRLTNLVEVDLGQCPPNPNRVYVGERPGKTADYLGDWAVCVEYPRKWFGKRRPLAARNEEDRQAGVEWGHTGVMARMTALRILLDATGSPVLAWKLAGPFMLEVVGDLDPEGFRLTHAEVMEWVHRTAPTVAA